MPAAWLTWQGLAAGRASRRTPSNLVKGRPRAVACHAKATKEPSPMPPLRDASAAPQTNLRYLAAGSPAPQAFLGRVACQFGWPKYVRGGNPGARLAGRSARDAPSRRGQRCPPAAALGPRLLPASAAPASLRLLAHCGPGGRRHGPLRSRHEREAGAPEPLPAPALEHHGAVAPESAERHAGQRVVY